MLGWAEPFMLKENTIDGFKGVKNKKGVIMKRKIDNLPSWGE